MPSTETRSFNDLVAQFLGSRLPEALAGQISFPELPEDARGIVLRMLALMRRASYPVTEFNPHMMWLLSKVTPAMLPSAWGGRIPPVTAPGRHRRLDAYVAGRHGASPTGRPVFVDVGCGFPPMTTADTARAMPDWSIYGVDRSFAGFVLYDTEGQYGCFDRDGRFQYFQSPANPLHENPKAVRARFESLFAALFPLLEGADDHTSHTVEKDGNRLVRNPIRDLEAGNLKYVESDIEALELAPAQVVRCMNVLIYFEESARYRMRASMGALLAGNGMLITGTNHPFGIYNRYAVFRKGASGLSPVEFAFSPDNLRPLGIAPWLTINGEDAEVSFLAELTGAIRKDRDFWADFDSGIDALQVAHGICRRGPDGFNHFTREAQNASPPDLVKKTAALWRQAEAAGYTDGAVAALGRAGFKAWKNPVGDIAVAPPEGALFRG